MYDVVGDLTMKGATGEVAFPATIYLDTEGKLHAEARFEFDRTQWGITAGSGSFFDDLADNVIDDMVAVTFSLVATAS
jgi:polyisoprenoid-binding protein YceI